MTNNTTKKSKLIQLNNKTTLVSENNTDANSVFLRLQRLISSQLIMYYMLWSCKVTKSTFKWTKLILIQLKLKKKDAARKLKHSKLSSIVLTEPEAQSDVTEQRKRERLRLKKQHKHMQIRSSITKTKYCMKRAW